MPADGDILPAPGGGDAKGDAAKVLAVSSVPKGVEAAEQRHGRADADVRLAKVGEDREDEYGVGVKMEEMDLVIFQDPQKEVRKGRHEAGTERVEEDGVEPLSEAIARKPHLRGTILIGALRRQEPRFR